MDIILTVFLSDTKVCMIFRYSVDVREIEAYNRDAKDAEKSTDGGVRMWSI